MKQWEGSLVEVEKMWRRSKKLQVGLRDAFVNTWQKIGLFGSLS